MVLGKTPITRSVSEGYPVANCQGMYSILKVIMRILKSGNMSGNINSQLKSHKSQLKQGAMCILDHLPKQSISDVFLIW